MERHDPDLERPDPSGLHLALQETLRAPDTFASALHDAEQGGGARRWLARAVAKAAHFLAHPQVVWNTSAARTLEAAVRASDERDRWIERVIARLRAAEERVAVLETELRAARAAEEDVRTKLVLVGLRLREIDERGSTSVPGDGKE
jgi:hypothetical protein